MFRGQFRMARNVAAQAVVRVRTAFQRRGAILMYHRIAAPASDPWRLAVSPANFAAHMAVIRQRNEARPLSELVARLDHPGKPDVSIAVTFDDGYLDNLTVALPIMEAAGVPATVYVVSGAIGRPEAFWWEFLNRVFLEASTLPEEFSLTVGDRHISGSLGPEANLNAWSMAAVAKWHADFERPRGPRQQLLLDCQAAMAGLSVAEQRQSVDRLAGWAGLAPAPAEETLARPLTAAELHRLARSPLIEIGGHTVSHPDLSAVPAERGAQEIRACRMHLQDITGGSVTSFGYPYGRSGPETCRHVAEAGFANATCSRFGIATARANRFQIPRLQVPNIAGAQFEQFLNRILGTASQESASPYRNLPGWDRFGPQRSGMAWTDRLESRQTARSAHAPAEPRIGDKAAPSDDPSFKVVR
jgi:peptidoglycan/xylan/chitin deacetylase (PgdA/CDA1 family)